MLDVGCSVSIVLDPLRRNETPFLRQVADGARMAADIGPGATVMGDSWHMGCLPGTQRGRAGMRREELTEKLRDRKMGFLFIFMSLIFLSADFPLDFLAACEQSPFCLAVDIKEHRTTDGHR